MLKVLIGIITLVGSVVGGALVMLFWGPLVLPWLDRIPTDISYDFLSLQIALIQTFLGLFAIGFAVLAFWGYSTFASTVEQKVVDRVEKRLKSFTEDLAIEHFKMSPDLDVQASPLREDPAEVSIKGKVQE